MRIRSSARCVSVCACVWQASERVSECRLVLALAWHYPVTHRLRRRVSFLLFSRSLPPPPSPLFSLHLSQNVVCCVDVSAYCAPSPSLSFFFSLFLLSLIPPLLPLAPLLHLRLPFLPILFSPYPPSFPLFLTFPSIFYSIFPPSFALVTSSSPLLFSSLLTLPSPSYSPPPTLTSPFYSPAPTNTPSLPPSLYPAPLCAKHVYVCARYRAQGVTAGVNCRSTTSPHTSGQPGHGAPTRTHSRWLG